MEVCCGDKTSGVKADDDAGIFMQSPGRQSRSKIGVASGSDRAPNIGETGGVPARMVSQRHAAEDAQNSRRLMSPEAWQVVATL